MIPVRRTIFFLTISFAAFACGPGRNGGDEEGKIRPAAYSEGDTLELDPFPPGLGAWLAFYQERFPGFRNRAFKASGVVLHVDSMMTTQSPEPPDSLRQMLAWNTDSSLYIEIGDGGDIDQEVVLGKSNRQDRRLLMFNGPGDVVETADWLGKDVFIMSRSTIDVKNEWTPSIYLFSLKDSTFTDFRWTGSVPADSVMGLGDEFPRTRKTGRTLKH